VYAKSDAQVVSVDPALEHPNVKLSPTPTFRGLKAALRAAR
jgi:hypothetical protein